jgi:hypothetical protein
MVSEGLADTGGAKRGNLSIETGKFICIQVTDCLR